MRRARHPQRTAGAMLEGVDYDSDTPLDDGFREEYEVERQHKDHMSLLEAYDEAYFPDDDSDSGHDTSLRSEEDVMTSKTEEVGWTGPINAVPGPSRITPPQIDVQSNRKIDPSAPADAHQPSIKQGGGSGDAQADAFAERFKYLVCSSGILEKDYVPGLGGGASDQDGSQAKEDTQDGAEETIMPVSLVDSVRSFEHDARRDAVELWDLARDHWNISVAVAVLALGLRILVGPRTLMLVIVASAASAVMWSRKSFSKADPARPDAPTNQAITDSLTTFLDISRGVDATIDSVLRILQPHSSTTTTLQPLRLTLYRVLDDMVDAIAAATSTLLGMVDKDELAVLGQMYDIPVGRSFMYKRAATSVPGEGEAAATLTKSNVGPLGDELAAAHGNIPSPRRPAPAISSGAVFGLSAPPMSAQGSGRRRPPPPAASMEDRFTSLPRRTPRLSKRSSYDREIWAIVRDQAVSRPKHERRITEASEETDDGPQLELEGTLPPIKDDASRNFANLDPPLPIVSPPPSSVQMFPSLPPSAFIGTTSLRQKRPSIVSNSSLSPNAQPHTPRRASPLSRPDHSDSLSPPEQSDSDHPPASTSSAPPYAYRLSDPGRQHETRSTPQPAFGKAQKSTKRLSLQNMPYYRSVESDISSGIQTALVIPKGEGLERTRSLPHSASDLQELRSRYATGSRRNSIHSASGAVLHSPLRPLPHGPDNLPFPQDVYLSPSSSRPLMLTPSRPYRSSRVPSVSPLTLPALKASCLGVHNKRRRLACCLLGLDFANLASEAYAQDVREVLGDLSTAFLSARAKMATALEDIKPPTLPPLPLVGPFHRPATSNSVPMASSNTDFAPRSSDAAVLLEGIGEMQKMLHHAWADLAAVQSTLLEDSNPSTSFEYEWRGFREHLGRLVREWERGKEAISRLASAQQMQDVELEDTDDTPDFLRTWEEADVGSRPPEFEADMEDSSVESNRPLSLESLPGSNCLPSVPNDAFAELPPIGIEEVFEGAPVISDPVKIQLGSMGRNERIALMKAARDKGMTLSDMLNGQEPTAGADNERKRLEGDVVRELGGLMDMIRQRKSGMSAPTSGPSVDSDRKHSEQVKSCPAVGAGRATATPRADEGPVVDIRQAEGERGATPDLLAELRGTFPSPFGLGIVSSDLLDVESP